MTEGRVTCCVELDAEVVKWLEAGADHHNVTLTEFVRACVITHAALLFLAGHDDDIERALTSLLMRVVPMLARYMAQSDKQPAQEGATT